MNGLLIYSCCSWCVGTLLLLSHRTDSKLTDAKGHFGLAAVSRVRQFMILLSPLLLPVIGVMWIHSFVKNFRQMRTIQKFAARHHDPEHIPVNVLHLNTQTQHWFKQQTPEFFALGFEMIGDFRYRTQPFEIISRHFLSADGRVVGSLITMNGTRCAIELSSIDAAGVYVGSCTVGEESMGDPISADKISIHHIPLQPLSDVVTVHQERLRARGCEALAFGSQQVQDILQYGSRCMSEWKFQTGQMKHEPPVAELPQPPDCR